MCYKQQFSLIYQIKHIYNISNISILDNTEGKIHRLFEKNSKANFLKKWNVIEVDIKKKEKCDVQHITCDMLHA